MIIPLTLCDFLYRAEHVYGNRVAVVDEPSPPGGSLGTLRYRELAEKARSLAKPDAAEAVAQLCTDIAK